MNADVKEPPKGDYYRACLAHCRSISNPELIQLFKFKIDLRSLFPDFRLNTMLSKVKLS